MDSKLKRVSNPEKLRSSDSINPSPTLTHLEFTISDQEFRLIRELIYDLVGIQLNDNKKMLVISRLSRRLRELNIGSFGEYHDFITGTPAGTDELVNLINQITTNKTDFFRESHHFDFLNQEFLPAFFASGSHNLRIWSAGCSTGEEPYTIAMTVANFLESHQIRFNGWDIKILATDVDTNVLEKARIGIYRRVSLKDVPQPFRGKFFETHDHDSASIKPLLKELITFRRFNLTHQFPFQKGFDIIFCRNVLIYFSQTDRLKIIRKFNGVIRPEGYLLLGHSESLLVDDCGFHSIGNTIYAKS